MRVQRQSPGLNPVLGLPYSPQAKNLRFKNHTNPNFVTPILGAPVSSSANSFKPDLSFGCRQLAFMTEGDAPSKGQQSILRDVLVNSGNSLKAQSKKRLDPVRDGVKVAKHEEDLLQDPEDGNLDGWGLAMYAKNPVESSSNGLPNTGLEVKRSLLPAFQDVQYDTASEVFVQKKPFTLLAHILNKVDPRRILIDEKDTHPFSFQNWSAMFNGFFNGSRTPPILEALDTKYYPALGARPQGTNSGEMIMFYFLGKLKSQFGTLDSSQLGLPKLQRAFAETLQAYYKQSDPMYSKLDGSLAGLKGKIQWGPSSNYFVTDGKVLMAYRKGRKLYLNQHVGAKGKLGYLVSSEPIQPKNKKLSWVELPQDHILTLAKQPDGKIEASLTPMTVALTQPIESTSV